MAGDVFCARELSPIGVDSWEDFGLQQESRQLANPIENPIRQLPSPSMRIPLAMG
jgi:hypothetical protein